MKSLDSIVSRNGNFAWRIVEGNAFIVDSGGNMLHELNETGSRIWKLMDGRHTLKEIASEISREFDTDQLAAEKDVVEFISELEKKGLAREK